VSVKDALEDARPFYGPGPCEACRRWPGERHASSCRAFPGAPVAGAIEPRPGQTWTFDPPARLDGFDRWVEIAPRPWRMRLVSIATSGRHGRATLRLIGADDEEVRVPPAWFDARNALAAKYGEAPIGEGVVETHASVSDLRAQRRGWRRGGGGAHRHENEDPDALEGAAVVSAEADGRS
jgi:hypothetical protein